MPQSSESLRALVPDQPNRSVDVKPPRASWHAEHGLVDKVSRFIWTHVSDSPFRVLGIVLVGVACTRPQILHMVSDVPWSYELRQGLLWAFIYGAGAVALVAASICGMVLVIPGKREMAAPDLSKLPWRLGSPEWRKRPVRETLGYVVSRYTALDLLLHGQETAAATPAVSPRRSTQRWLVGLGFLAAALFVWIAGMLERSASPWAGGSRRLLLAVGLGLSAAWFLIGHDAPNSLRRRAFGRYALMTLIGLVFGEVLWSLPNHFEGWCSYRYYTIWAVTFLLFFVVATGRLMDRIALRARFVLVVAAVYHFMFTAGFAVDTHAAGDASAAQQALVDEGEEWFGRLEQRIGAGDPSRPVVFVAASGGGSRAAIFASLVYEYLNRITFDGGPAPTPDKAIARNVAAMSAVSGGSLATAYYLVQPHAEPRSVPRNFTAAEVAAGMVELADDYEARAKRCQKDPNECPVPDEHELVRSRRSDASASISKQLGDLAARRPAIAPWLFNSAFVDDMATDFMAPLLRGVMTPFLERGHSVSDFWAEHFGWIGTTQRSCLTTRTTARGWLCDWSSGTPPPLALLNATNVANGRRVVIGYPPVPMGLLGSSMESLSDSRDALDLSLADGVRLSANFPWGFEIGTFDTSGTFVLPSKLKLTDGGVADNSGLDTLATLLERLGTLSRPLPSDEAPKSGSREEYMTLRARRVRDQLVRRGVMLIEIDSGARPARGEESSSLVPALTDPLDAMSLASFGGARTIKSGHILRVRAAVEDMSRQVSGQAPVEPFRLFHHVPFVCNHDTVMTAWALGPRDKAKVMMMFLVEAEANAAELVAHQNRLRELQSALAQLSVDTPAPRKPVEDRMSAKMIDYVRQGEEARLRGDNDEAFPQNATVLQAQAKPDQREGWIYLGKYDDEKASWITTYLGTPKGAGLPDPHNLTAGVALTVTGRSKVREDKPADDATFAPVKLVLRPGSNVTLAARPVRWQETDFVWARVKY